MTKLPSEELDISWKICFPIPIPVSMDRSFNKGHYQRVISVFDKILASYIVSPHPNIRNRFRKGRNNFSYLKLNIIWDLTAIYPDIRGHKLSVCYVHI